MPSDEKLEWPYGLKDEEVTLERIKTDLGPLVDEHGRLDEDRSDAPYQLHELVDHVTSGPPYHTTEQNDACIARVVRTAVALERKFSTPAGETSYREEELGIWLALEVAMVWEFG